MVLELYIKRTALGVTLTSKGRLVAFSLIPFMQFESAAFIFFNTYSRKL